MLQDAEKVFFELDELLEQSTRIDAVFRKCLKNISRSFKVKRVSLMLLDETRQELFIHESEGLGRNLKSNIRVKLGEGISGWVAQKGEGVLVQDIERNRQFKNEKKSKGFRGSSFICIPLKVFGRVYGVLNVSERSDGSTFKADELHKLELFGMQLAILVENSYLQEKIKLLKRKPLEDVAEVSHDFRIPLTCLQEVLHLMGTGELGPITDTQREFITLANRNVRRMISTFDHLIEIATRATEKPAQITKVELGDLVCAIRKDFEARVRRKRVHFETKLPATSCWAFTDERRLYDVLLNLVDNAVKFTKEGTDIHLIVEPNGSKVRIRVCDQGPGIPAAMKKALFDKKASVQLVSQQGLQKGHGLGLAISYDIMKSLGGSIGFRSKKGQGTEFYIELPKKFKKRG